MSLNVLISKIRALEYIKYCNISISYQITSVGMPQYIDQ